MTSPGTIPAGPLVYHNALWLRLLGGIAFGIPGGLMGVLALITGLAGDSAAVPIGVFAMAFLWLAGETTTRYVRLTGETIETGTVFGTRRMRLDQIAGKQFIRGRTVAILLFPAAADQARFAIAGGLNFDAAFWAWLDGIPNHPAVAEATDGRAGIKV